MDQSVAARSSSRIYWSTDDIRRKIEKSKIVVFAKGTPERPRDGFSQRAMTAVQASGRPYEVIDVMQDKSIGAALREYAGHRHLPLIFVNGDLVSTSDNLRGMMESGELDDKLASA